MNFPKLTQDLGPKIFVILAAIGVWLYVSAGQARTNYFPSAIPLEFKNTPEGLIAVGEQTRVKVKISAETGVWKKLQPESFRAYVDLTGLSAGTYELEIRVGTEVSGVEIVEKVPNRILITLEPKNKKEVPIRAKLSGSAAPGMAADQPDLEVDTAVVSGAQSTLKKITEAIAPIALTDENENFERVVTLVALDEQGQPIPTVEFEPAQIKVAVRMVSEKSQKEVVPEVNFQNLPGNLEVKNYSPAKVIIVAEGPPATLAGLSSKNAVLNIDLVGLPAGKTSVEITPKMVSLPPGIGVVTISPNTLEVEIEQK